MKRLFTAISVGFLTLTLLAAPALAEPADGRVFDHADILTEQQEEDLQATIENFQSYAMMDCVVLTEEDAAVSDPELHAQDYYDAAGFGLGEDRSGMILYVNMATRDVAACASGDAKEILGNRELDRVIDAGYTALADGDYYVSFSQMIGKASGIVGDARQTVAVPATARFEIRIPIEIIAVGALFGGIVGICIYVVVSKRYQTPIREAIYDTRAKTDLRLIHDEDLFVNKFVTVRHIPRNPPSSGSGGSSFRSSSSRRSFSRSSRKF